jgi:predicted secreted Zn-dependent protease
MAVHREPGLAVAWKWLAYCSPDPLEALEAARRVYQLNPADEWVHQAWPVLAQRAAQAEIPPSPPPRQRRRAVWPLALVALLLLSLVGPLLIASQLWSSTWLTAEGQAALEPPPDEAVPVIVNTSVSYYTFEASNVLGIQQALATLGPRPDPFGERAIAMTTYNLRVDSRTIQRGNLCELASPSVYLNLSYIYPQWVPSGSPSEALYNEWDRFIQHVRQHEERHGQIALGCAQELAGGVAAIPASITCDELQARLSVLLHEVEVTCESRQAAFDVEQGRTSFPLPR